MANIIGLTSRNGSRQISDIELLKEDLMNHFMTIRGELDWNSSYGTTIPLKLFELSSEIVKNEIKDEVQRVLMNEPKISSIEYIIIESIEKGYSCECKVTRADTLQPDTLYFSFKNNR